MTMPLPGSTATNEDFLTLGEAARYLRKSESGLRKWLADATIPPHVYWQARPGGRILFNRAALQKWAQDRA
jgi:excisionase family DNA binding protein